MNLGGCILVPIMISLCYHSKERFGTKMDNEKQLASRFVFSITDETRNQLNMIAKEQECSAAAIIRRLIKQEYTNTRVKD